MSFAPSKSVNGKFYYVYRQGPDMGWHVGQQNTGLKTNTRLGTFTSLKKAKSFLDSI